MLLALLMLVVGLLGGPLGGPPALWFETDLAIGVGMPRPSWLDRVDSPTPVAVPGRGGPPGGADARPRPLSGGGVPASVRGGGVELAERGGPLGGGGAAFLASVFSAPAFLLIHRLSSGS